MSNEGGALAEEVMVALCRPNLGPSMASSTI